MFKHFAQFSTSSETWATRATWATETPKPKKPAAFEPDCPVAQTQGEWATEGGGRKTAENCDYLEPVAQVAQVAQKNDKPEIAARSPNAPSRPTWDAEDWQAHFDERAGIVEYDGELSRADAEQRAFECCVVEWLWRNPPPASGPAWCTHCGEPLGEPGRDGLPFLTGDGSHTWLHSGCHGDWTVRRRAAAAAALEGLGIHAVPNRT